MISSPLHILDCCPLSYGAAAVVVTSTEIAKEFTDTPIYIKATAQASDYLALYDRKELTTFESTVTASRNAYHQAQLEPKDIDVCEVHDCFTIAKILAIEDLGFFDKGSRVFIWNEIPTSSETPLDIVLGQETLQDTFPHATIDGLHMPSALSFDDSYLWTNELKFSDRLVRFPVQR